MPLNLMPNIADPDGFYDELLRTYEGLGQTECAALNAKLILILANHIGDRDVLSEALLVANTQSGAV